MKDNSVKINLILNGILRVSSMIFPLVTFPYVSRVLGAIGMGKVTFANSIVSYFAMFAQLGIPTYGIRECSKVKNNKERLSKTVYELLIIELILSIFVCAILVLSTFFVKKFYINRILLYIGSVSIFLTAISAEWLYQALEEYQFITIRSIAFKAISLVLMFLVIHDTSDAEMYMTLMVLASSGSYICNLFYLRKFILPINLIQRSKLSFKVHFKGTITFFAMTIATTVYTNLDNIMLGFMTSDSDVGYYNSAVKVKSFLVGAITSIGVVLLPRATMAVQNKSDEEFSRLMRKSIHLVEFIAVPIAAFFTVFSKPTIMILSGSEYAPSVLPMEIILPTVIFIGITNILGYQVLVPLGGELDMLVSVILGAITDLIINMLLIPGMKSSGAAIGTLIAEFVVLVYQYIILRRKYNIDIYFDNILKILLISLLSSVIGLELLYFISNVFLQEIFGCIVFFGVYSLIMIAIKDEIAMEIFTMIKSKFKRI